MGLQMKISKHIKKTHPIKNSQQTQSTKEFTFILEMETMEQLKNNNNNREDPQKCFLLKTSG